MKPAVAYLAVLQFHVISLGGHWHAVPPRPAVHLACGGEARVWGDTLCGIPFGVPGAANATVGGGVTGPNVDPTPCPGCLAAARLFPEVPILGVRDVAQPVADLLGVPLLARLTSPTHPGVTP